MKMLIVCVTFSMFALVPAAFANPFKVEYLALEATKFQANRDPYTPNTPQDAYLHRAALQWNVSLLGAAYWNNYVHTETVPAGVKTVGWQWELGMHVTPWLDLFKNHHSRHVMEEESNVRWKDTSGRFPVEDGYGLRIVFIPNGRPSSLLP